MNTENTEPLFEGFSEPTENWFKFPVQLIHYLPDFDKKQIVLLTYLLRHTWGYQDDDPKKITIDEFMNGRKKRDGTRIDRGTGLAKTSIIDGLELLEQAGFITVEIDDSDKARIEKWYAPRMSKIQTSDVQNLDTGGTKIVHRTEKDNKDKKTSNMRLLTKAAKDELLPVLFEYGLGKPMASYTPAEITQLMKNRLTSVLKALQPLDDESPISDAELRAAYRWFKKQYRDASYPIGANTLPALLSNYRASMRQVAPILKTPALEQFTRPALTDESRQRVKDEIEALRRNGV